MAGEENHGPATSHPPEAWGPLRRLALATLAPVERFLAIQAASGVFLIAVAAIALIWANSPWRHTYEALWEQPIGFRFGPWTFERDLRFWINDGLMTLFFFVVGLEIRHETHRGELSELRRAALPLAAALGGMLLPACIFVVFNPSGQTARGWGIPMATDIAFAVGVLALLGTRVPQSLRILLLALAVIDDVGAIIVIATFYSPGIAVGGLVPVAIGLVSIVVLQRSGVRSAWAYLPPALVLWGGAYATGVHPTLAGVVIGLMTPARAWLGTGGFTERAAQTIEAIRREDAEDAQAVAGHLREIDRTRREAISPGERLLAALNGWVAFGIMPLFALANAGVSIEGVSFTRESARVFAGIAVGLVLGKPLGIVAFSWIATRLRLAVKPRETTWLHILLVGLVGGIGFTMALFVAQLAFPVGSLLDASKLAILCASTFTAILALVVGRLVLSTRSTKA